MQRRYWSNNSALSKKTAPPLRVKQTHHIIFETFLAKAQGEGFSSMCLVYIKNQFKHAKVVLRGAGCSNVSRQGAR